MLNCGVLNSNILNGPGFVFDWPVPDDRTFKVYPDTFVVGVVRKQPNDIQDYDIDFSEWLLGNDVITDVFISVAPFMPISPSYAIDTLGKRVKVWVYEGGVSGTKYQITVRASAISGRTKEVELRVKVKEV